jgi:hypothetical protein
MIRSYNTGPAPAPARAVVGPGNVFSKFVSATDLSLTLFCFRVLGLRWRQVSLGAEARGASAALRYSYSTRLEAWNGVSLPLTSDVEVKSNRNEISTHTLYIS